MQWLDTTGAVTASATETIAITASGSSFSVTAPTSSPYAVTINTNQPVAVYVPATIGGVTVANVRYATTLGSWLSSSAAIATSAISGPGANSQTFVPGNFAGNATVQIDALSGSGTVLASATLTLSITASTASATTITLQSNSTVIPPSSGTTQSTATLTAYVTDGANPVGGAPVLFQLLKSTGSGESISPVVATTNTVAAAGVAPGYAQATYTAGTLSTTQNNQVRASIVGATGAASSAVLNITVGGTAGSIAIGASTTVGVDTSNTYYTLPLTLFVTDSSGAAVSGAVVSLSLWPTYYYKGTRTATCVATYIGGAFANEDTNKNLVLDSGEDIDGPGGASLTTPFYGPADGKLWPALAAAGAIPTSVTTDTNGRATFTWSYLKEYANWISATISATTRVSGSESTASTLLPLMPLASDIASPCALPASPFN